MASSGIQIWDLGEIKFFFLTSVDNPGRLNPGIKNNIHAFPHFSLLEMLLLVGTAGADGIAPPTSTTISARLKC